MLVSVTAGLDLEIASDSFNHGRIRITCRVNVFHLYNAESEIFVEEERPRLASVLGTRESSYTGNIELLIPNNRANSLSRINIYQQATGLNNACAYAYGNQWSRIIYGRIH